MRTALLATGLVAVLSGLLVLAYNELAALRLDVATAWSALDAALGHRHALVSRLVIATRGYGDHDREALGAVIAARTAAARARDAGATDRARAEQQLASAVQRLLAATRPDADIQASRALGTIRDELADAERRIAALRRPYNLAVQRLNRHRAAPPARLLANRLGVARHDYFEVTTRMLALREPA